jgi:dTMP kinase
VARHLTRRSSGAAPSSAAAGEGLAAAASAPAPTGTAPAAGPDGDPVAGYAERYWPDDSAREHDVGAVLGIKPFRRLWLALAGSSFGDWLGLLATAALAKNLASGSYTAENFAIAGVFILRLLPAVLLGPLAGVVADRLDRRWTLVLGDVLRFALFATIPLVGTLTWLYTATVLIECVALFWMPAKDATIPNLVPPRRLEAANQISLVATYGTAPLAALVYAGMALVTGTVHDFVPGLRLDPIVVAIYLNALTFLVSGLVIWRLDIPATGYREHTREGSVFATILDGWRFIGAAPVVRGLVIGMLGAFGAAGFVVGLSQTFVQDLGAGQAGFGVLFGAVFVGLAAGMWLGPRLLEGFSRRRLFGLSLICAGAFLVALALIPSLVAAVFFTVLIGACGGIAWVTGYTLLGLEVDDEVRGRTFAFLQSAARVVLVLVLAAGPAIAAPIGTHTIKLAPHFELRYNGSAWVFLLSGVLALVLGFTAYRHMDDRRGVPLLTDLLSAWRGRAFVPAPNVPKRMLAGYLIALEGGDGAGKSTQAAMLADWLRDDQGHDVVLTREPGATPLGARLRKLLLNREQKLDPRTEALLFAADRADHVASLVRPAMERGAVVVTDRYVDSSIAYQGTGRDLDPEAVAFLSRWATDGLMPDLTVLLDIPSEFSRVRRAYDPGRQGEDRLEALPEEFHERVRTRFLELARAEPQRYLVLDGTLAREEIQAEIRRRVRDVVPLSSKLRAQLAEKLAHEEEVRRRRAEAEAEVLRLDAELRGRQRDESRARMQARRRLREEAESQLAEEAERHRLADHANPVDHAIQSDQAIRSDQGRPEESAPTAVLDLGDPVSDRGETLRP